MAESRPTPVLFIHGLWVHSDAWRPWVDLYTAAGYQPIVEGWPGDRDTVAATRAQPTGLNNVGIDAITKKYAALIETLDAQPIVVGHSFGGLVAQKLLAQGLAAKAIAIDPGPIKGVTKLPFAQIRTALPVIKSKKNRASTVALSERQFRFGFANAVSKAEATDLWTKWSIPGPGRPLFEATEAKKDPNSPTAVDTTFPSRGPLLIIGGGKDHTVPEVVSRQAFELYNTPAPTAYKVFPDRGHSLVFDSGWRTVADYTLEWLGTTED